MKKKHHLTHHTSHMYTLTSAASKW